MKNSVLAMLLRYVNSQFKRDTNYVIAQIMLKKYTSLSDLTINEMADMCFVSVSSISRFVKILGFSSFAEFKNACKNTLAIQSTDYSLEVSKAKKGDIEPIISRYTESVTTNIRQAFEHIDYAQMDRITQDIYESQDVLFLGLEFSTFLGQHFQSRMALMNKYVKIGFSVEEQVECVREMRDGSVVLIASIEGGYFYRNDKVIQMLHEKKAKIILITMNSQSKLMKDVREVLICSKDNSNTEGRISLLYIIEIIIMYYCINFTHLS